MGGGTRAFQDGTPKLQFSSVVGFLLSFPSFPGREIEEELILFACCYLVCCFQPQGIFPKEDRKGRREKS